MHKVFSILLNAIKLWLLLAKCPAPTIQWNGTTLAWSNKNRELVSAEREWARNTEQFSNQTCLAFGLSIINFQFSIQLYWMCYFREWLSALTWGTTGSLETCSHLVIGKATIVEHLLHVFHPFLPPHPIFVSDPELCLPPSPLFILALPAHC